jgi:hypothetical protein
MVKDFAFNALTPWHILEPESHNAKFESININYF